MAIDKIFFGYMAVIGIAVGAALVAIPSIQNMVLKPYFWVLLAVVTFDVGAYLLGKGAEGDRLLMPSRLLGFLIGVVLMVAIPALAGTTVRYF